MECKECHTSHSYPGRVIHTDKNSKGITVCNSCRKPILLSIDKVDRNELIFIEKLNEVLNRLNSVIEYLRQIEYNTR